MLRSDQIQAEPFWLRTKSLIDLFTAVELPTKIAFSISQTKNTLTGHQIDNFIIIFFLKRKHITEEMFVPFRKTVNLSKKRSTFAEIVLSCFDEEHHRRCPAESFGIQSDGAHGRLPLQSRFFSSIQFNLFSQPVDKLQGTLLGSKLRRYL